MRARLGMPAPAANATPRRDARRLDRRGTHLSSRTRVERTMTALAAKLARPAVIAAAGIAAAAAAGATAAGAPAATCRAPERVAIVYRSVTAVVYQRRRANTTWNNWACLRSSGRRMALPGSRTSTNQRNLSSFRSAGRYLAFFVEEIVAHDMRGSMGVSVYDLRRRQQLVRYTSREILSINNPDRLRLRGLVLTATGTAAWRETGRVDRIAALDLHSRRRVLDSGVPDSLHELVLVRGTIAQWRSNGRLRHRRIDQLGR
jgi:hypothetical protein